ncbi:apolipoprotein N-acyltransferase [Paracoccus aminophilus]|uniref:Apolipoprotein N-acyltransferase n=1 Tax=Paracoccus aminophilus JCM 7686 TaxID=1367847 RepID=S5XST5_PARAH|nr:apolipoprotein N-acyltransferase [Paracoccus aminophilus]AGT08192.1 apolipoprotein N-acyltransferase [Paracoccus aminophilus JCM 7686]
MQDQPATSRPSRQRRIALIGLDLLLGVAGAFGQAPWGLWPLAVLGLAGITWRVGHAATPRIASFRALTAGFGYFALAMSWIVEPFLVEPEIYGWMAPFALFFMALGGALFWAVPSWLAARLTSGWRARGVAFAAVIVLSDWCRGWLFTGLPWALTGHIWIDTPAAQTAALFGSTGLSALTMLAAALPVALWRGKARAPAGAVRGTILSALLIASAWFYGTTRLAAPLPPDRPEVLRLVQPNAEQRLKWDPYWSQVFFQRLVDLSAGPTADGSAPAAVIWPETAVNFLLEDAGSAPADLTRLANAPVLLGIQRREDERYFNSFVEFRRDGQIGQTYDKFHLVPFGEYTPWGDALSRLGISAFAARYGNGYTPGVGPRTLHGLGDGLPPVQVLICYEAIFSRHVIRSGPERPEWLLQITNDAWFGTVSGPWQHLAQTRLRAIESGLPMIRVANTGVSAVIDAHGNIRQEIDMNVEGRLDARLPAHLPPTLWSRTGDWPAVLAALALFLGAVLQKRGKSRKSAG